MCMKHVSFGNDILKDASHLLRQISNLSNQQYWMHRAKPDIQPLCPSVSSALLQILQQLRSTILFVGLCIVPTREIQFNNKKRLLLAYTTRRIILALTGNPEISEYFLAGLKLGGALMELSENYHCVH